MFVKRHTIAQQAKSKYKSLKSWDFVFAYEAYFFIKKNQQRKMLKLSMDITFIQIQTIFHTKYLL